MKLLIFGAFELMLGFCVVMAEGPDSNQSQEPPITSIDKITTIPDVAAQIYQTPEGQKIWESLQKSEQGLDILIHLTTDEAQAWFATNLPPDAIMQYLAGIFANDSQQYLNSLSENVRCTLKQWLRNLLEINWVDEVASNWTSPWPMPLRFSGHILPTEGRNEYIKSRIPICPGTPLYQVIYGTPSTLSQYQRALFARIPRGQLHKYSSSEIATFLHHKQKTEYNHYLYRRYLRILIPRSSEMTQEGDVQSLGLFIEKLDGLRENSSLHGKQSHGGIQSKCPIKKHLEEHVRLLEIASLDQGRCLEDETSIAGIIAQVIRHVPQTLMSQCTINYMNIVRRVLGICPNILPETAMWCIQDTNTLKQLYQRNSINT
ncbi:MAG: hypothetical protein LBF65_00420 [Holosporales bacterium]|jgi:tRNA (Thr-GGU) A37 N-methylase|nr:hypothetical protein [Holosporales bacterium]